MAELADALDLGSSVYIDVGFKSLHPHSIEYSMKVILLCRLSSVGRASDL
ncbi:protein of unknown function [Latilactobacillus sakei]|nr:protein of unknown function [Latilactobacillus sakei]